MRDRFCEVCAQLLHLCESAVPTLQDALDGGDEARQKARETAAAIEAVAWDVQQQEEKDGR